MDGYGDSNNSEDHIPESHKMKDLAIKLGVNTDDILIEDQSSNTYENIINAFKILDIKNIDTLMIITSEFHLKRCKAIINKIFPEIDLILIEVTDGIHDRNNWFVHENVWKYNGKYGSGKNLVIHEAKTLVNEAFNGRLADLEIK